MSPARKLVLAFLVSTLIACMPGPMQTEEYVVKAVFLERFTRFVQWPRTAGLEDTSEPFLIGVLGENPFGSILEETYGDKTIFGKRVEVVYFEDRLALRRCHLLFISQSQGADLEEILEEISHQPVLVVSDAEGFARRGVHINFYIVNNRIRFEINSGALRESGLSVSYRLLQYARLVGDQRGQS